MDTIRLGEVTISRVIEIGRSFYPTSDMLPDSTPEAIARHHGWIKPHFWDNETSDIGSRIQTYVVRTPGRTVLIDTGVGNDKSREGSPLWHMRRGGFLDDLAAAGVRPEDVDLVLCTHMHVDHVGWNTRLDPSAPGAGRWVPTFPRARYLFAGEEWEFWRHENEAGREHYGVIADSVVPVVAAGQADFVEATHAIDRWLRFEPWPGHTPGHASVRVTTSEGGAVFSGDLMHRVVQVAEPQWSSRFCHEPGRAAATRRAFVERHAGSGDLILPAHFPHPGRIVRAGGDLRFERVALEPIARTALA